MWGVWQAELSVSRCAYRPGCIDAVAVDGDLLDQPATVGLHHAFAQAHCQTLHTAQSLQTGRSAVHLTVISGKSKRGLTLWIKDGDLVGAFL